MNLGQLKETVRAYLDDYAPGASLHFWTDAEITTHLNEADREACRRALFLRRTVEMPVVANQGHYQLAAKTADSDASYPIEPIFIETVEYGPLRKFLELETTGYANHKDPFWMTRMGEPSAFLIGEQGFWLWRRPPTDSVMYVTYTHYPDAEMISDADTPATPIQYHDKLIYWVLYRCLDRRDADTYTPQDANSSLEKFEEAFGKRFSARHERFMRQVPGGVTVFPRQFR